MRRFVLFHNSESADRRYSERSTERALEIDWLESSSPVLDRLPIGLRRLLIRREDGASTIQGDELDPATPHSVRSRVAVRVSAVLRTVWSLDARCVPVNEMRHTLNLPRFNEPLGCPFSDEWASGAIVQHLRQRGSERPVAVFGAFRSMSSDERRPSGGFRYEPREPRDRAPLVI